MIENSGLTVSDFKVGMKVSFVNPQRSNTEENIHEVIATRDGYVQIMNDTERSQSWFPSRFVIVNETTPVETQPETFDYIQAMKHYILDQNVELEYEAIEVDSWITVNNDAYCMFPKDRKYRFKPKKVKQTFQFLIKSKGKYSVTKNKYEDEDQVKKGYSYPVEVIQKLEG